MTTPDYPAAHSMDTIWYAVDSNGAVAVFSSGEAGPVPKSATRDDPGFFPTPGGGGDSGAPWSIQEEADRGLYVYEVITWEYDFIDTYERVGVPKRPLHLDQLPPTLRQDVAKCHLPKVDFAKEEELQLVGLVDCDLYWDEAVACFAPGHKELWPIPGKEKEYRAALPQLRKDFPGFRFADPAAPAPTEPARLPKRQEDR